jgi:hypothetical protein
MCELTEAALTRAVLLLQPNVPNVPAPVTVVGDIHGQAIPSSLPKLLLPGGGRRAARPTAL